MSDTILGPDGHFRHGVGGKQWYPKDDEQIYEGQAE